MRRILYLFILLILLSFASRASAQGVAYHDIAFYNSNGNVRVVASALITVCASGWTSPPPCAPALGGTLFSNFALTNSISNPFNADANGNFNFIAVQGNYTVCITGAGVNGTCNQVTLSSGSSSAISGGVNGNLLKANSSTTGTDSGIVATNVPLLSATNSWTNTNTFQTILTQGILPIASGWYIGSTSFPYTTFVLGTSASAYSSMTSSASAPRTVVYPDASGTLLLTSTGVQEICSGQIALTTALINANSRATNTLTCTGLSASTDSINCAFSGDTNAVVGYTPGGGIALKPWVSANTINVDQQNTTGLGITPGAATITCKGLR
jgi:hypothetical protein